MHHKGPNLANKHILCSLLKDRPFFQRRLSGSSKNAFKCFLFLKTISHNNTETCTPCPFIQNLLGHSWSLPRQIAFADLAQL